MKQLKSISQTIVFLLLILSCSNPTESKDEISIYPNNGVENIKLGDHYSIVHNEYENKCLDSYDDLYSNGHHIYTYISITINYEGIKFYFSSNQVSSIVVSSPFEGITENKMGIGSTLNDVKNKYGEPEEIDENHNWYKYQTLGISFSIVDSKVEKISIYKAD